MKHSFIILIVITLALSINLCAQNKNSRHGCSIPPIGTFRILVVFADVIDDTCTESIPGWDVGELPRYKDSIVDDIISNTPVSYLTKFFNQSSFGQLNIIGDYYPELLEFNTANLIRRGDVNVVSYLNQHPFYTMHNHTLSDFDNWT